MGYTHYWYRKPEISQTKYTAIVEDFGKIVLALADMGVQLADGCGENIPIIDNESVVFNGYSHCGHPQNQEVSIPWPARGASGVDCGVQSEKVAGTWFAGALLATRTCDGDCSYETFAFDRVEEVPDYQRKEPEFKQTGQFFQFCKTAYRPYDLAVTAFLIIAKHHLGADIKVTSDGDDEQWQDAKRLCYIHLGYGPEYGMYQAGMSISKDDPERRAYPDVQLVHKSEWIYADAT